MTSEGVSAQDSRQEFFQVLFGSDPRNDVTASAFFGFMNSSQGKSANETQAELQKEKELGQHSFTGILSRVEPSRALSLVVPLLSDADFSLRDYDRTEPIMLQRLADSARPVRSLQDSGQCPRATEFLGTVAELTEAPLAGQPAPLSRCYVYDAEENALSLEKITPVDSLVVKLHGPNNVALLDATHKDVFAA
jgi:hypothetical protein